MPKIAVANIAN